MKLIQVNTGDGSHTLYAPEINDHYHSTFGAIQESQHIFINSALRAYDKPGIRNVLEIGFGTGLNALLTCLYSQASGLQVNYYSLEPYPLEKEITAKLNYPGLMESKRAGSYFTCIHDCLWDEECRVHDNFRLMKIRDKVEEAGLAPGKFNIVYFDAFRPDAQPELWKKPVFEKISRAMVTGGVLATYSVKGSVKRALRDAGFEVVLLPGPPGKRLICQAWKK